MEASAYNDVRKTPIHKPRSVGHLLVGSYQTVRHEVTVIMKQRLRYRNVTALVLPVTVTYDTSKRLSHFPMDLRSNSIAVLCEVEDG